ELLVVIAIIAILVAILLPALRNAKGTAQEKICGANLHQLMIAVAMYETDYEYVMPAVWGSGTPGPTGFTQGQHLLYIAGYLPVDQVSWPYAKYKAESILSCPLASSPVINWDGSLNIQCVPGGANPPAGADLWDSVDGGSPFSQWARVAPGNVRWSYGINFNIHQYPVPTPDDIAVRFPSWAGWRAPYKRFTEPPDRKLYFIEHHVYGWVTPAYLRLEYSTYRCFRVPHLEKANFTCYDGHVATLQRRYYLLGSQGLNDTQIAAQLPFVF
ncbi:MAG: hypothetical protein IT440_16190, partial [Phycisphaeraceae bacterium]|nr:hypothetical protein [Phycisphaeraceae bacterium]